MTATVPEQAQTAFRGVAYGFDVVDHASFMAGTPVVVPDDYVGKTRQRGRAREMQHRDDKPWSDLIVGSSHALWEGICTEDELDEIERRLIREKAPRLNDRDNRWNPDRISLTEQVRQRRERDALRGDPPWAPLEQRRRESLLEWDTPQQAAPLRRVRPRRRPARRWKPWQRRALGWFTTWAGLTVACWIAALAYHLGGWQQTGSVSAAVWAVLLGWIMCGCPWPAGSSRRARRWRRRLWR